MLNPGDIIHAGMKLGEFIRTDVHEIKAVVSIRDLQYLSIDQEIPFTHLVTGDILLGVINRFFKKLDPNTQVVSVFIRGCDSPFRTQRKIVDQ